MPTEMCPDCGEPITKTTKVGMDLLALCTHCGYTEPLDLDEGDETANELS